MKSVVQFVRGQLGFKGTSEHSGRGSYMCHVECNWPAFKAKVLFKLDDWKARGLIDKDEIEGDKLKIKFNKDAFESDHYHTLVADKTGVESFGWYLINM